MNYVIKRDGSTEIFDSRKIVIAVRKAYKAVGENFPKKVEKDLLAFDAASQKSVEQIQDEVECYLMKANPKVAQSYIRYRYQHQLDRAEEASIRKEINYMMGYQNNNQNAATSSATDPNANMNIKNVANMEAEVYKPRNRKTQRIMIYDSIKRLYGEELADQYLIDLESHLIYIHDEASSPAIKNYCEAVTLYPLVLNGTSTMDGTGTSAPHCLQSFVGQLYNLTFLLTSQCKGAVAFGEFFNYFDYYAVKDFGSNYTKKANMLMITDICNRRYTIEQYIEQMFQTIVFNWNQPAGNRAYQSPFTNISYYDSNYWKALFGDFFFPDGTQPNWERVDWLQRKFMKWFNKQRQKVLLTFPVETMAMLTDKNDIIDKEYKSFTAEMYAEGHSFFTYLSDNPDSLSSCCRLKNEITENVFSFTNGLTGVQTGSCNVITINLNRLTQDWVKSSSQDDIKNEICPNFYQERLAAQSFRDYLTEVVKRIHKYHIAYKTMLYEWEARGMFTASNAGYISMNKLYSTIGLNGINEAAEFLGIKCNFNEDYKAFCNDITKTISDLNKLEGSTKFRFNTEFVPAEGLSSKNYQWDKADGYWVPKNRNLYNSYFYLADDPETGILDRFMLHGREFTGNLDGGSGLHCNLSEHLSYDQYMKLLEYATVVGCSYFTFNVPNCQCDKCGYIEKRHFEECPKCGSTETTDWTRVIGYLRPVPKFDKERYKEALTRVYSKPESIQYD